MKRVFSVLVDVVDGILAAVLYSRQGGMPYTLLDLEHMNQSKIRQWSAGSPARADAVDLPTDDIDTRIRAFRARRREL